MPDKIVLAYSGGLDTSVILRWLQNAYDCEVVAFIADIGQLEDLGPIAEKARSLGAAEVFVEDLVERFASDYVYPMFRANALYEGEYLLGTSIARPLIASGMIDVARRTGADAVAHGATGKGNDQVRFELGAYALMPEVSVIAPWRIWDLSSREALIAYADAEGIPVDRRDDGGADYSMDANLLHVSYEGGELEDPWHKPPPGMWRWTTDPVDTPDSPQSVEIEFEQGDAVAIDGQRGTPAQILARLNELGGAHGVGRIDMVENRYVGMKSRGCYETPGGTLLHRAHRAAESITLDREAAHLKDELMPRYAQLVYNGFWFSPERAALQAMIDQTQQRVNATVRLSLHKGNVMVTGRRSDGDSLYSEAVASFDDETGAYSQEDAEGFIRLNALRLRAGASRDAR